MCKRGRNMGYTFDKRETNTENKFNRTKQRSFFRKIIDFFKF